MTTQNQETTPDQLLESFRGRSFKSIILFTIVVHLVIVFGSSVPYLMKSLGAKSDSKLSEAERTEIAAREATSALRDIAVKHGLKPQDLSNRIAGGAAPAAAKEETPAPTADAAAPATGETEKPKTAIEAQLEVKEDGPTVPPIPAEEATDDDLFE
jgi:type IV secretory pathway TrbL component